LGSPLAYGGDDHDLAVGRDEVDDVAGEMLEAARPDSRLC
jgi:hypothetical protein